MFNLALIGEDLSHSKSKEVYKKILGESVNYTYLEYSSAELIPNLTDLILDFDGISITSPYKSNVFHLVSTTSDIQRLKSVNCIALKNGVLKGTNTDYLACLEILKQYIKDGIESVLVTGDGSMSIVIQRICYNLKLKYRITSRKIDRFALLKNNLSDYNLVINTCARSFDLSSIKYINNQKIWDLNYDQSYFVRIKDRYGDLYTDGSELLYLQAKFACKYWEIN